MRKPYDNREVYALLDTVQYWTSGSIEWSREKLRGPNAPILSKSVNKFVSMTVTFVTNLLEHVLIFEEAHAAWAISLRL